MWGDGGDNGDSSWGVSHLSSMPVTMSYGLLLLGVLIVLIVLRFLFADVTVRGGVK